MNRGIIEDHIKNTRAKILILRGCIAKYIKDSEIWKLEKLLSFLDQIEPVAEYSEKEKVMIEKARFEFERYQRIVEEMKDEKKVENGLFRET